MPNTSKFDGGLRFEPATEEDSEEEPLMRSVVSEDTTRREDPVDNSQVK